MIYLTKDDLFVVYLSSMISSNDRDVIFMLYQPIIGHDAVSLYFTLYSEFKKQEDSVISSIEALVDSMDISISDLEEAKKKLEGIGLIQTFYKKKDDQQYYIFKLYAPKSPAEFFQDVLLKGLLVRELGERKVKQISNMYRPKEVDYTGYTNISYKFQEVFHPDLDSNDFNSNINVDKTYKKRSRDISKEFDRDQFLNEIKAKYNFKKNFFSKKDLDEIARISLLYGVNEDVMADYVASSLNVELNEIDYELVAKKAYQDLDFFSLNNHRGYQDSINTNSLLGKKVELLSSTSPFDYLKIKQNNSQISPSDARLLNDLSSKYNLAPQVINALLDYVLENYNNTLPTNLVFKIAASLNREKIETTIDAMNYLKKNKKKTKKEEVLSKEQKEVTDQDVEDFMKEIEDL